MQDYFGIHGYRQLALAMLEQAAADLNDSDSGVREQAQDWFRFDGQASTPAGTVSSGLTFGHCVSALGLSSWQESLREKACTAPKEFAASLRSLKFSAVEAAKVERAYDLAQAQTSSFVLHDLGAAMGGFVPASVSQEGLS